MHPKFDTRALGALLMLSIVAATALPAPAQTSPDVIVSIIRQDCGGEAGCFETLSAWTNSLGDIDFGACPAGDLVCANKAAVAEIQGSWTAADVSAARLDDWVTGPANYLEIRAEGAARHNGVWSDTAYRRTRPLVIKESYVRISGLQFDINLRRSSRAVFVTRGVDNDNSDIRLEANLFRATGTTSKTRRAISARRGQVRIWNNILYGFRGNRVRTIESEAGGVVLFASNNTLVNCSIGIYQRNGLIIAQNNLTQTCDNGFLGIDERFAAGNLSDVEDDAPGDSQRGAAFVQFVDAAGADYHLSPTDATAIDAGRDLSADLDLSFTDDIDGEPRGLAWDVGADEAGDGAAGLAILAASVTARDISTDAATIVWTTNLPATSRVDYGTSPGYGSITPTDTNLRTAHSVRLTGLPVDSTIFFRVRSEDGNGNTATAGGFQFRTARGADVSPPDAVNDLSVSECGASSCTLNWTAPADDSGSISRYQVRYSPTLITESSYGGATIASITGTPAAAGSPESYAISGLDAASTYYFAVTSTDAAGNRSSVSNSPRGDTTAPPAGFNFLVYGDSRSGSTCASNAVHLQLLDRMIAEPADMVFHTGDMVTGFDDTTNFASNGSCTAPDSFGNLREQIDEFIRRTPVPGLPTAFFPVVGNHDDSWGSGWYPDPTGGGFCDTFDPSLLQQLVPNHTRQPYFRDTSERNYPILTDFQFYTQMCSKDRDANGVYPGFMYYSFDHQNAHFVVLRVNTDGTDLEACNGDCDDPNNYDQFYNIHQLHWLQADLAEANANPAIDNIFVFLHAPVFTSSSNHAANDSWQILAEEFTKGDVTMVFNGHNHVYERTVPIRLDDSAPNGTRDDERGTVYVTTGGAGSGLNGFGGVPWFFGSREREHHYMRVNVDGGRVSVQAVGLDGTVIDEFAHGSDPTPDTTPPAEIGDLAVTDCTASSCSLTWTAPGDDGANGQATSYEVRYATTLISDSSWAGAQAAAAPTPRVAGSTESTTVTGLDATTTYFFAVRATDEAANRAGVGNSPSGTTETAPAPDTTAPAAVEDLSIASCDSSSCTLTWTAPGDDGNTGQASSYDLRYSTSTIDAGNWSGATTVSVASPKTAGAAESAIVSGLQASTTYYFAIRATDEASNTALVGNVPNGQTSSPPVTDDFSFLVYGNSRAGGNCSANATHAGLVGRMSGETADFAVHLGDMITGYSDTTNWTQSGSCSDGSFRDLVDPLLSRTPTEGLPMFLLPTLGNHDDNWGSGWYPDAFGSGICDVYGADNIRQLIPNHTQRSYFRDKSGSRRAILDDATFYSQMCAKTQSEADAYPRYFYYSFDHENVHFVVMRVSAAWQDLLECDSGSCANEDDYSQYPDIHQVHWLQDDLQRAAADPATDHIVVFLHTPIYSSGENGLAGNRDFLSQTFSTYGVDMVFSGDNRIYERTVPILTTAGQPNGVRDDAAGTTYVMSGGGGAPLEAYGPAEFYNAYREAVHHYVRVNVSGGQIRLEAVDDSGRVIDSFVLNR